METFCEGFYAKFLAASGYLTFLFAVVIVVYCVVYESQAERQIPHMCRLILPINPNQRVILLLKRL